jgi:hypothetical protein
VDQNCRVDATGKGVGGVKFTAKDSRLGISRQENLRVFFLVINAREWSKGCFVDGRNG